jgi:PPM family protein phosphatase
VIRAFGVSEKGCVRPINEDCFGIVEALGLCIVADGMGGHNAGEVAARIAVDAVVDHVRLANHDWPFGVHAGLSPEGNRVRNAILLANVQILETAVITGDCAGMGTTVVAARIAKGRLTVGHVGDSRLYLLAQDRLRQVTEDDSWTATVLARQPSADPLILQHHPMRHALTNVVGARTRTDVHVVDEPLSGGELVLLTTDGVHGVLDHKRIAQLARRDQDPRAIAERLVDVALARGTRDNCTAVVAQYIAD